VHVEAARHYARGRTILLIGHAGHPEVIGTIGQLPEGAIILVEDAEQAETVQPPDASNLAYSTQTTLSVEDAAEVIGVLKRRFPHIAGPHKEDICYATTNRQEAIKRVAPRADVVLVIGSPNSSNSQRLVEVARRSGAKHAGLIGGAADIDWSLIDGANAVGLSAGASAPEVLVEEVIAAFRARYDVSVTELSVVNEDVEFKLPRALAG
jgi:4-hydroxy-3-methylbut-2-enyl diphosphate reductase